MKVFYFYSIFLLLCCSACYNKAIDDTVSSNSDIDTITSNIKDDSDNKIWTDTVDRKIAWEVMIKYEKIPQLEFEEISKGQYLNYKKLYLSSFINDSSKITTSDSFFMIQTSTSKLKYVSEYNTDFRNRYGFSWTNYKGYIKPLHLYVMEGWYAGEFTLGDLFFIDSTTNILYAPSSISDYTFEVRALSPDNKYIVFGLETSVEIGEIKNTNGLLSYKSIAYGNPGGINSTLEEVMWISDHKIALKISKREDNKITKMVDETIYYMIADIPLE